MASRDFVCFGDLILILRNLSEDSIFEMNISKPTGNEKPNFCAIWVLLKLWIG